MGLNFNDAMSVARQDFKNHIAPLFHSMWSGCEIYSNEKHPDPLRRLLDDYAGKDYVIFHKEWGMSFSLASRIQRTGFSYGTFTVRNKRDSGSVTEYEKRRKAIVAGAEYPTLTLQAYLTKDGASLLKLAIMRTVDLFDYLRRNESKLEKKHTGADQSGQAEFVIAKWSELDRKYAVSVFEPKDNGWLKTYRNNTGRVKEFLRRQPS